MFPIEAIVLRKILLDHHRVVMTCFSREYGKIDIFHRENTKGTRLDTLSLFTGQVRTKEHNTLSSLYKIHSFQPENDYHLYDVTGWLVSVLFSLLPHGLPYPRLFQILKTLLNNQKTCREDVLLFLIQMCRDFGITQSWVEDYYDVLQSEEGYKKTRSDIEGWIFAYQKS